MDNSNVNQALQKCSIVTKNGRGSVQFRFSISFFHLKLHFKRIPGWVFKQNESTDTQIKKTDVPATTYNKTNR